MNLRADGSEMELTFPKMAVLPDSIFIGPKWSGLAATRINFVIYDFVQPSGAIGNDLQTMNNMKSIEYY